MELRKSDSYMSCIKIRGVPIVPPLMTEDIRTEMRYYKHLALAVEEKLQKLKILESSEHDSTLGKLRGKSIITMETGSSVENDADVPGLADASDTCKCSESISDEEASSHPDDLAAGENVESEVVTASTDLNQYMNDSFESEAMISTMDNSPESKKPEVPRTLDIVPITVDANVPLDPVKPHAQDSTSTVTTLTTKTSTSPQSDETTPKLVRQGSYVLDTPSPMLLAHLRDENTPIDDYVPTSINNGSKRKEWNISEAKSEWELQNTEILVVKNSREKKTQDRRVRRNSTSGALQSRPNRPAGSTRTGGKHLEQTRQIAKSADCIRSMVSREYATRRTKDSSSMKNNRGKESPYNVAILSLADKLGGSLGSLTSSNSVRSTTKRATPPKRTNLSRPSKSFDEAATSRTDGLRGSTRKLLSAVTSEKIIDVFKEIQRAHERQMSELVARQQREQREMQKEFEKQQVLLLAQIEQTFPGICLPKLAQKLATPLPSPIVKLNKTNENSEALPRQPEINGCRSPEPISATKCPLDDIYPRQDFQTTSCQRMRNLADDALCRSADAYLPSTVKNGQWKNSGVSRELFPLESETSHVPILSKTIYEEKHMKAATIINAYARGYLVRRIMQTERVIALKSTYGEALRCMLKLHVDAPLALPELNFHQRLQLQCDAASMNIVELFAQEPAKRMEIIQQDRQIKRARQERPNSARSCYSFATQRTLARKKKKEMGDFEKAMGSRTTTTRSRCQTWASNAREKRSPSLINQGIKRSTSAGAVRKPWR